MSSATLTRPLESDSLFQSLVERLQFAQAAENWSRCVSDLSRWEDDYLLDETPAVGKLTQHKKILERLIFFGQFCALISSHPDFDDTPTAEMIEATQTVLRHKLRMWHGRRMSKQQSDLILKEVFPEP
jgi:hypothetical protein